jgi:hypothetical protein
LGPYWSVVQVSLLVQHVLSVPARFEQTWLPGPQLATFSKPTGVEIPTFLGDNTAMAVEFVTRPSLSMPDDSSADTACAMVTNMAATIRAAKIFFMTPPCENPWMETDLGFLPPL